MLIRKICILGGTGFVGQTLANKLAGAGYQLRILTRNREVSRRNLILLPGTELVETDIHVQDNLDRHFAGCDAVINLVGILNEKGRNGSGFHHAHVALVEKIIHACRANGVRRVQQMSALNADAEQGPSFYLRSKGQAEQLLLAESDLQVSCFQPSVIFGARDSFFNRFAGLLKITPLVFPLACAEARFAPVYVEDVAMAFTTTLRQVKSHGRSFRLCGPSSYSLRQLVEYTAKCLGLRRRILTLGDGLSRFQAAVFDFVPGKPFSTDNYLSATRDSVCECNDLPELGISPQALEAVVPRYLGGQNLRSAYSVYRQH